MRIALEAEAILNVLVLFDIEAVTLVSSEVLHYEVNRNRHPQRHAFVSEILARTTEEIILSVVIEERAIEFQRRGFKTYDALHLACAEAEQVDYFCTCDDRFLRRAKAQTDISLKVVSPLELVQEIIP